MAESTERTTESESRSEHLFCPHCGTENNAETEHCDRCGERVSAPELERHQPSELATCAKCSTATFSRARHCVGCGVSLDAVKPVPYEPAPVEPSLRHAAYAPTPEPSSTPERPRDAADRWPLRNPRSPRAEAAVERRGRVPRTRPPLREEPNDSGTQDARLPDELRGFNWAAFLLAPIWGVGNRVWIAAILFLLHPILLPQSLLMLTVLLFLAASAFLGYRGNELAWKQKKWLSKEHFRRSQQAWARWAIAINGFLFVMFFMMRVSAPAAG